MQSRHDLAKTLIDSRVHAAFRASMEDYKSGTPSTIGERFDAADQAPALLHKTAGARRAYEGLPQVDAAHSNGSAVTLECREWLRSTVRNCSYRRECRTAYQPIPASIRSRGEGLRGRRQ